MSTRIEHLCITIMFSGLLSGNVFGQNAPTGYLWLKPDVAKPIGEFNDKLSKKVLWGLDFGLVVVPYKKAAFWETGLQIGVLFPGSRKDKWNGIELKTSSALADFNLINRFRPFRQHHVEPFLDLSGGISYSSVSSSYEITDKATFLEEFFLDEEDEVETEVVKDFRHASWGVGIGAGVIINRTFIFELSYNYSPEVEFVNKEDVTVEGGEVIYRSSKSTKELVVFSVGLSLERFVAAMSNRP